jgi:hypothetical protein
VKSKPYRPPLYTRRGLTANSLIHYLGKQPFLYCAIASSRRKPHGMTTATSGSDSMICSREILVVLSSAPSIEQVPGNCHHFSYPMASPEQR